MFIKKQVAAEARNQIGNILNVFLLIHKTKHFRENIQQGVMSCKQHKMHIYFFCN